MTFLLGFSLFTVYDKLERDPCAFIIDGLSRICLEDSVIVARILHHLILK